MMMAEMAFAGHSACGKRFKPAPPLAPVAMMLKLAVPYFTNGADVRGQGTYEACLKVLGKANEAEFRYRISPHGGNGAAFCFRCSPKCATKKSLI